MRWKSKTEEAAEKIGEMFVMEWLYFRYEFWVHNTFPNEQKHQPLETLVLSNS